MNTHYVWRRRATAEWLCRHEAELAAFSRGSHAVIERPPRKRIEVEIVCGNSGEATTLQQRFGGTITRLSSDWLRKVVRSAKHSPLRIGRRLVVSSERATGSAETLSIPAGAAFGTGEHATTAMSLRLLEHITRQLPAGWSSFDAGTGSGILALAASRFGAREIVALDDDPLAIKTARANAKANGIRGVRFVLGDARQPPGRGRFDVITANLFSELLIAAIPRWKSRLKHDGRMIISGILRTQEREVVDALVRSDMSVLATRRRGRWVAILSAPAR